MGTPPEPNSPSDPGSFGPKLYGLSGQVNRPGCYEAPLGITVRSGFGTCTRWSAGVVSFVGSNLESS
jgi:NADH:ubiquinone oxidoreductase subunit F (NADH-binding)